MAPAARQLVLAVLLGAAAVAAKPAAAGNASCGAGSECEEVDVEPQTVLLLQSAHSLNGSLKGSSDARHAHAAHDSAHGSALAAAAHQDGHRHRHGAQRPAALPEGHHRERRRPPRRLGLQALLQHARGAAARVADAAGAGGTEARRRERAAEVSRRSSISSVLMVPIGLVLIAFSFPILWINEKKAARYESLVQIAAGEYCALLPGAPLDARHRGLLVHVAGAEACGAAPLQDRRFKELKMDSGALRIRSTVEQYQEISMNNKGGGKGGKSGGKSGGKGGQSQSQPMKMWSHLPIGSIAGGTRGSSGKGGAYGRGGKSGKGGSSKGAGDQGGGFQLDEGSLMPGIVSTSCSKITVGEAFVLPQDMAGQLGDWRDAGEIVGHWAGEFKWNPSDNYYYKSSADPSAPQINDQRVKFEYVPNTTVSIMGVQCDIADGNKAIRRVKPERPKQAGSKGGGSFGKGGFCGKGAMLFGGSDDAEPEPEDDEEEDTAPMTWATVPDSDGHDTLLPWRLVPRGLCCCAVGEEELKRRQIAEGQRDPQELLEDEKCGCSLLEEWCCCVGCCFSMGNCVNSLFSMLSFPQVYCACEGTVPAEKMLKQIKESTGTQTWLFRGVGWVMMLVGFMLLFSPIFSLLDLIPLVGSFLSSAVTLVVFIVAFVLTLAISTLVIAVAYLLYRPFVGIAYLLLTAAIIVGTVYLQDLVANT